MAKPGTIIKLPDGREGTIVYNGLDGQGIMFGRVSVDPEVIYAMNTMFSEAPADYPYRAEAMLRDPKLAHLWPGMECVGTEYEVVFVPATTAQEYSDATSGA